MQYDLPSASEEPGVGHPAVQLSKDLLRSGKTHSAVAELRKAAEQTPSDWRLHASLGDMLMAVGREEEAIGAFMRAVQHEPQLASACVKIGRVFFSRDLSTPALFWLRRAMEIDADREDCLVSLAMAEARFGCRERVADLLDLWVAKDPGDPVRQHLATAILGESIPTKAPEEYVEALFDSYAPKFDESLAKLHYCGPQLIADAIAEFELPSMGGGNILDVGCGTGLVGESLRCVAQHLVGVDLSQEMLQIAAGRNLYDEICHAEMNAFMRSRPSQFNIVVAADVLSYCGDLNEFSAAVEATLCPGGRLIVTLEALEEGSDIQGYRLNLSGRFSHQENYLKECFARHGLTVLTVSRVPMRHNLGRPVPSLLATAEKENFG